MCIYSILCLKDILPSRDYGCWAIFADACFILVQPSLSKHDLERADEKLLEFCKAYESLYGKERCTPNMHMHLHLKQSLLNYGPACAFW